MTDPAISVRQLRKTYPGGVEAVKGIDFEVGNGEVFGLLGPNGAGKSTTIGVLTTTITPTGGSAQLAGFDVVTQPIASRGVSGVVFQEPVVDATLSGHANLAIHAALRGLAGAEATRRIDDLAAATGVAGLLDRPVATYSGGERRRLEIARALVCRPRILFLDEPTVGLDPRIRFELLDVIGGLRESGGMTILLTTHYLEEADRLCDRVAVMHQGRIVAMDTPERLRAALGREIVELRVDSDAAAALAVLRTRGIAGEDAFHVGTTLTVPVHDRSGAQAAAAIHELAGLRIAALGIRAPSLDDVYLRLTGDRLDAAA